MCAFGISTCVCQGILCSTIFASGLIGHLCCSPPPLKPSDPLFPCIILLYWRGKLFSCQFDWQNFLYNSRGLDVIILLVKYYAPLAHINKVIKLLKFNCNEFLVFLIGGAIERAHSIAKSHPVVISRLRLPSETLQIHCRFKL